MRSSTTRSSTGSRPERSEMASALALSTVKLPEIEAEPPRIGSRIDGAEMIRLSRMIAKRRPTLAWVTCAKRWLPWTLKLTWTETSLFSL